MRAFFLLGAAVVAASCLVPSAQSLALESPRPLSGRQLQVLLLGNTLIGLDEDGPYWMYYPSADTLWGRSSAGDVDVGRWWIENDSYCRAWRRWFQGQTRCWQMARVGEAQVFWYSLQGEPTGRSIVREGNAMGDVPSEVATSSQLADAGTGLASALDAVVAHAVVSSDEEVAPRDQAANGTGGPENERIPRAADSMPPEPKAPFVPRGGKATKAGSATSGAGAAAAASSSGFGGTRLGGFLDRIGVRSASPAGAGGGGTGGGSGGGGGGGQAKGGSERDRG
jgi:hypothetical protein